MDERFAHLFDPGRYGDEGVFVEFRAHRGDEGASVVASHALPDELFSRMVFLGRAYELHHLGRLQLYEDAELNQLQARGLADELRFLDDVIKDSLLGPHLIQLARVADVCWRTSEGAALLIEGP